MLCRWSVLLYYYFCFICYFLFVSDFIIAHPNALSIYFLTFFVFFASFLISVKLSDF